MQVLIPADRIHRRIAEIAAQVAEDYRDGRPLTLVGVLTGSLMFVADLARRLERPLRIGLVKAASYRGPSTRPGDLAVSPDLTPEVAGRHVLLLDDILDSGRTVRRLVPHLHDLGAASVRVGVLLRKSGRQEVPFEPDYCGFEIPDVFVVGYGLDFNDDYRHLPYIAVLPEGDGKPGESLSPPRRDTT